jgi:hypothetical protein
MINHRMLTWLVVKLKLLFHFNSEENNEHKAPCVRWHGGWQQIAWSWGKHQNIITNWFLLHSHPRGFFFLIFFFFLAIIRLLNFTHSEITFNIKCQREISCCCCPQFFYFQVILFFWSFCRQTCRIIIQFRIFYGENLLRWCRKLARKWIAQT